MRLRGGGKVGIMRSKLKGDFRTPVQTIIPIVPGFQYLEGAPMEAHNRYAVVYYAFFPVDPI